MQFYSQRDNDRETTRYLSAAALIDLNYAKGVVAKVVHEPYRALAPAHGADVTVVARWALESLRRIMRRDATLTVILFAGVILSWLLGSVVGASAWLVFATVLVMLGMAFNVVAWEHWTRWYRTLAGRMLRDQFRARDAPDPAEEKVRQRLRAAAERRSGNLVVFSGDLAFVGSGRLVGQQQIVVDASRGREDGDDADAAPIPFTNSDVNTAIAKAIADIGLPGLNVALRAFVNGRHVRGNQELQETALKPPRAWVSEEILHDAAEHPSADARAYVCAEIHGWQGQLVVSMFARAVHAGGWLYIEYSFYVLPPISSRFTQVDLLYSQPLGHRLRRTAAWGLAMTVPYLIASPVSLVRQRRAERHWYAREWAQGRMIERGRAFDYGAISSIREEASQYGTRHYFIKRDITMYVLLLQKSLLREMESFLIQHNIAIGDFKDQAQIIIKQTNENYSVNIGNVSDSNFSVGGNASSTGKGSKGSAG